MAKMIDEMYDKILEKTEGGILYGERVDAENVKHMVVAAYYIGMNEKSVEFLRGPFFEDKPDDR